ncbi:amino acid permease [Aliidiomarina indica]|uniref:amino acid permease n=1 Tax=Aliidiomarina indica TaxID=2749147 RepID=UPI00188EDD81|nr:amino acid permease [Aliidiomarina indica]
MSSGLKRQLGLLPSLTIGLGTMIGAGIFILPASAFASAGPAAALAFVIGGIIAIFTALSISELGTGVPKAGGAYYYIDDALGPLLGTIAGLGNWLGLAAATGFYLVGFGSYLQQLIPVPAFDIRIITLEPAQVSALAAAFLLTALNYIGTKATGFVQSLVVMILLVILLIFLGVGSTQLDMAKLQPFAPEETGGWLAVLPTVGLIFVTFLGFAEINTAAEEMKNTDRNLPFAVIGSVLIVIMLYTFVMIVLAGTEHWTTIVDMGEVAVSQVAEKLMGPLGLYALITAGILATFSSANASILASSRISFAMSRDRILHSSLSEVHPKRGTPHRAILLTGAFIFGFILIGDLETLAKMGSILHLLVYGLLNVALIAYRETNAKNYKPAFKVPLYPVVPVAGALMSFGIIAFMAPIEIMLSIGFGVFAIAWYFMYARSRTPKAGKVDDWIESHQAELPKGALDIAQSIEPHPEKYRILVILGEDEEEEKLIDFAALLAEYHEGEVIAVDIEELPEQTPLHRTPQQKEESDTGKGSILERATKRARDNNLDIKTGTLVSRSPYSGILKAAEKWSADVTLVSDYVHRQWRNIGPWRRFSAMANHLPCNFIVLCGQVKDLDNILLPTDLATKMELSVELARAFQKKHDCKLRILHVTDQSEEEGKKELEQWADAKNLSEAELVVHSSKDISDVIAQEARDASLVILGTTGVGFLWRATDKSRSWDIMDSIDTPAALVQLAHGGSWWHRMGDWFSKR